MKNRALFILTATLAFFLLCACQSAGKVSSRTAQQNEALGNYIFYEAQNQSRFGNAAASYDLLGQCLKTDPESAPAKYNLALYLMALNDKEKPGQLLLECTSQDPDNWWYWNMLATFYTRQHSYREAISIYEQMIVKFPGKTDLLFTLMGLYDNVGEYSKGLDILARIEESEGESMRFSLQRFQFYLEMGKTDSAYLSVKPEIEWVIENLSEMVSNIDELNTVRTLCKLAIQDFPDNLNLYYHQCISDYRAGEQKKAIEDIDVGISRISDDSDVDLAAKLYTTKGDISYYTQNMAECFKAYEKALELKPEDNMTANNYAYFLSLDHRELDKAEKLSRKTIESEPLNSTYLDTYAWILYNMSRYNDAKAYIDKALECEGDESADVYEHAGDIYYMTGDSKAALDFWHRSLELGSESDGLERKIKMAADEENKKE